MIRSIRVIHMGSICRALEKRGMGLHALAEGANLGIMDLRRLVELGSALDPESSARLASFYTQVSGTTLFANRYNAPQGRLARFRAEATSNHVRVSLNQPQSQHHA